MDNSRWEPALQRHTWLSLAPVHLMSGLAQFLGKCKHRPCRCSRASRVPAQADRAPTHRQHLTSEGAPLQLRSRRTAPELRRQPGQELRSMAERPSPQRRECPSVPRSANNHDFAQSMTGFRGCSFCVSAWWRLVCDALVYRPKGVAGAYFIGVSLVIASIHQPSVSLPSSFTR